jgi:hypothetical protein
MDKNKTGFVVLSTDEEVDLITRINSHLSQMPVTEFKVVKRGYCAGLWKKRRRSASEGDASFYYMNMDAAKPRPGRLLNIADTTDSFGMCVSLDIKQLAAVHHSKASINKLLLFPKGIHSDWRFLWNAYVTVAKEMHRDLVSLTILERSEIIGDCFHLMSTFVVPQWARRLIYHRKKYT